MKNINIEIKELGNSEIEITGEISTEEFEKYRSQAIKEVSKNLNISGFRKGNVPEDILIKNVGEAVVLEEMAQRAISANYPEILKEKKIDAIGRPEISITKIAKDNPLGFKIKTAIMPEVKLSDYKKIAGETMKKEEKIDITDKEVEDVILEIRKNRAKIVDDEEIAKTSLKSVDTKEQDPISKDGEVSKDNEGKKQPELPELNDEFAKALGDFQGVEDLKKKIKENLTKEKEAKTKEKKRMKMMDEIIQGAEINLPSVVIESELDKMSAEFEGNIAKMGLKFEKYLEHIKKTKEELRKEWHSDAEKRAKMQFILSKIVLDEKIEVPNDKIKEESEKMLKNYKDADPERVKAYVHSVMMNEKAFEFLESCRK